MALKRYAELIAWQKAMDLAASIYKHTDGFPKSELYCLTLQLRKAGISIPSNIAEGQARWSTKPFLLHLSIAYGSLCESETQILLASRFGYLTDEQRDGLMDQCLEVEKLLNGLAKSLKPWVRSLKFLDSKLQTSNSKLQTITPACFCCSADRRLS